MRGGSRLALAVLGALVGVGLLALGARYAVELGRPSTDVGADTPVLAVAELQRALGDRDAAGVLGAVDPREAQRFRPLVAELQERAPAALAGVVPQVGPLPVAERSRDDGVAVLDVTGGELAGRQVVAVLRDSRWFVSLTRTVLEAVRTDRGLPGPAEPPPATGYDSVDDALTGLLEAVLDDGSTEAVVRQLPLGDYQGLYAYVPLLTALVPAPLTALTGLAPGDLEVSELETDLVDLGDDEVRATVTRAAVAFGPPGARAEAVFDGRCLRADGRQLCVELPALVFRFTGAGYQLEPVATLVEQLTRVVRATPDAGLPALLERLDLPALQRRLVPQ